MLKYPGFNYITFKELEEFVRRLLQAVGLPYTPFITNVVAKIYNDMTREKI